MRMARPGIETWEEDRPFLPPELPPDGPLWAGTARDGEANWLANSPIKRASTALHGMSWEGRIRITKPLLYH
jgi:hypothetical protein